MRVNTTKRRIWQPLLSAMDKQRLQQRHDYKNNTFGINMQLQVRHSTNIHKTWAQKTSNTPKWLANKNGNWYVNSMQRWHSDERVAFPKWLAMMISTIRLPWWPRRANLALTEREASLPKHMEDTQRHTNTRTKRWNTACRAKSKNTPKSVVHFPLRPHLLHNTTIQCRVGGSNSNTPHCVGQEWTRHVDDGMKYDDSR